MTFHIPAVSWLPLQTSLCGEAVRGRGIVHRFVRSPG